MKTTHNGTSIRKHETDWNQRWLFAIKKILVMYSKADEIWASHVTHTLQEKGFPWVHYEKKRCVLWMSLPRHGAEHSSLKIRKPR